ncbi:MAG TPA: hypothetical protein VGK38_04595 [Prolixibacteraceae bacterium]
MYRFLSFGGKSDTERGTNEVRMKPDRNLPSERRYIKVENMERMR